MAAEQQQRQALGQQFMKFYYDAIGAGQLDQLVAFYKENSAFSFEQQTVIGAAQIMPFLQSKGSNKFVPKSMTVQIHACAPIVTCILIVGHVTIQGQTNPLQYTHSLQLVQDAQANQAGYWICNDAISLVYG